MSTTVICDNCKHEITATSNYWAIVLSQESHCNGEIDVHDVFYLSTFCKACSKQFDLESTQIPECQLSHSDAKPECNSTEMKEKNTSVYATCEICQTDIVDNTKYLSVSLHEESFVVQKGSFFASTISVHDHIWLHIYCESCARHQDFKSPEIPTRQPKSQEIESTLG